MRTWGRAKRKALGIPPQPRSIFGRIHDEGSVGAAIRGAAPDPPEVMLDIALTVSRARQQAIEDGDLKLQDSEIMFIHFVCHGSPKTKAKQLNLGMSAYYRSLDRLRAIIGPYITRMEEARDRA